MRMIDRMYVNGCSSAEFDGLIWRFPCGLSVADELARADNPPGAVEAARVAHERHHVEGHASRVWGITVTDLGGGKYEGSCGCRR